MYLRWCCSECGYKSFEEKKINIHSLEEHRSVTVALRSNFNMNIEKWVKDCIAHQENDKKEKSLYSKILNVSKEQPSSSTSNNDYFNAEDEDDDNDKLVICLEEDEEKEEKEKEQKSNKSPNTSLSKVSKQKNVLLKCKYCEYTTFSRPSYNIHEKRHWLVKPLGCSYCEKQFVLMKDLSKHHSNFHMGLPLRPIRINLPDKPQIVPLNRTRVSKNVMKTKFSFNHKTSKKKPEKVSKENPNDIDEKTKEIVGKSNDFSTGDASSSRLKKALTAVNEKKPNNEPLSVKEVFDLSPDPNSENSLAFSLLMQNEKLFYNCTICNSLFPNNDALLNHFKAVHQSNDMPEGKILENFLCIYCENKFEDYALLMDHHMIYHPSKSIGIYPLNFAQIQDTGEIKPNFEITKGSYDCIISACKMTFDNLHAFKMHVRNHYYIYKCELCMESFQFSSSYFAHCKKAHHNQNLSKCADNKQSEVLDRISQIDRLICLLVDLYKTKNTVGKHSEPEALSSSPKLTGSKVKQTARKSTASLMSHKKLKSDNHHESDSVKRQKIGDNMIDYLQCEESLNNQKLDDDDNDNDVLIIDC